MPKRAVQIAESERGGPSPPPPVRVTPARAEGAGTPRPAPISPHAREETLPNIPKDVTGTSGAVALDLSARARELLIGAFGLWNQKAAARELGIHPSTFKDWIAGRRRISADQLSHLFTILGPGFRAACLAPWENAGPTVAGFRTRVK